MVVRVGVVRSQTQRRWAVVVLAVAVLCALPVLASALPVAVPGLTAVCRDGGWLLGYGG